MVPGHSRSPWDSVLQGEHSIYRGHKEDRDSGWGRPENRGQDIGTGSGVCKESQELLKNSELYQGS